MRCLYCGKHLPLFRKLTGGGEFCSDAHRDTYHEEYNRLAVSRLLQAQARPEEPKPGTIAVPETPDTAVAVGEEPEVIEMSGSLMGDFQVHSIRRVVALKKVAIEVAPVLPPAPEPAFQSILNIQPASLGPKVEAEFLAYRASSRGISPVRAEIGLPSVHDVGLVFPLSAEIRFTDRLPREAGALALDLPSIPRRSSIAPLELGVSAIEPGQHDVVMPATSPVASGLGLLRPGSLPLLLSPIAEVEDAAIEIGLIENFPGLAKMRPAFEIRLKLLDMDESVPPEPLHQTAVNGRAPVVPITPRRVLEALSQLQSDRKRNEPQDPPLIRTIKPIDTPPVAPGAVVLTTGFDSILFAAQPLLLRYGTQPLRPKMAVGTAAGPSPVPSRSAQIATEREAESGEGKNGTSRMMARSMLHLDDEGATGDSDATPSLLGKLGGLFGKKSKTGKQEVVSQKSQVKRRNEVMRS